MKSLNIEEEKNIKAGANPYLIAGVISAIITFTIGIFSGYSNPGSCNN